MPEARRCPIGLSGKHRSTVRIGYRLEAYATLLSGLAREVMEIILQTSPRTHLEPRRRKVAYAVFVGTTDMARRARPEGARKLSPRTPDPSGVEMERKGSQMRRFYCV